MSQPNSELIYPPCINWFNTKCSDLWSSPIYFDCLNPEAQSNQTGLFERPHSLFVYGYKSGIVVAEVNNQLIRVIDQLEVFDKEKYLDRGNITTVAFARNVRLPVVFVGSKDGQSAVINLSSKIIYRPPDDIKTQAKITCADWLDAANLFYAVDRRIIQWDLKQKKSLVIYEGHKGLTITTLALTRHDPYYLVAGTNIGTVIWASIGRDLNANQIAFQQCHQRNEFKTEVCSISTGWTNLNGTDAIVAAITRRGNMSVINLSKKEIICQADQNSATKSRQSINLNFLSVAFVPTPDQSNHELMISSLNGQIKCFRLIRKPNSEYDLKPIKFLYPNSCEHRAVVFSISALGRFSGGPDRGGWNNVKYSQYRLPSIAVSVSNDKQIILWDIGKRTARSLVKTLATQIRSIATLKKDPYQLIGIGGEGIRLFDMKLFESELKSENKSDNYNLTAFSTHYINNNRKIIFAAIASHDQLVALSTYNGDLFVYDLSKGKFSQQSQVYYLKENEKNAKSRKVYSMSFGPLFHNEKIATGLYTITGDQKLTAHAIHDDLRFDFSEISDQCSKAGKSEFATRDDWLLAAVGYHDGHVEIFESNPIKSTTTFIRLLVINVHSKIINSMSWAPLDQELKSPFKSYLAVASDESSLSIHNLSPHLVTKSDQNSSSTQLQHPDISLEGHNTKVTSVAWSRQKPGLLVSASCESSEVIVWNIAALSTEDTANTNGPRKIAAHAGDSTEHLENFVKHVEEPLYAVYRGHREPVYCAQFVNFDSDLVLSTSADGSVHLWRPSKSLASQASPMQLPQPALKPAESIKSNTSGTSSSGLLDDDLDGFLSDGTKPLNPSTTKDEISTLRHQLELFKVNWLSKCRYPMLEACELNEAKEIALRRLHDLQQNQNDAQRPSEKNGHIDHDDTRECDRQPNGTFDSTDPTELISFD